MRIIETKVYKFEELSDEAKKVALEEQYQFEIEMEWWEYLYSEAEGLGFEITEFNIYHYCRGNFKDSACEIAENIIFNHGEHCDTYKTAKSFLEDWKKLVIKYSDGVDISRVAEGNEYDFDNEADDLEDEFKRSLFEDYRILLKQDFEALSDEEHLVEMITINNYEFTEDGKLI